MKKCFCDRCGKELDYGNMNYISLMIDDFSDHNAAPEAWDFCSDCVIEIKRAIILNIAQHDEKT